MDKEPTIRVSVEQKQNRGNYEHEVVVIALTSIPFGASETLIDEMLETAEMTTDKIRTKLRGLIGNTRREFNMDAFREARTASREQALAQELPPIPSESEVTAGVTIFGIELEEPPQQWFHQPLTREASDGSGGPGQLVAINTVLTNHGYKDDMRFVALQQIMDAYLKDSRVPVGEALTRLHGRIPITSTNDLTKAEAHLVLSWFDKADRNAINLLAEAAGGQQSRPNLDTQAKGFLDYHERMEAKHV